MILANPMMKMNFKKAILVFAILFAFGMSGSNLSYAESGKMIKDLRTEKRAELKAEMKAQIQAKFCEKISDLSSRLSERFSDRKERITSRRQNRVQNWEDKTKERDEKLADLRDSRDDNLDEHFKKIEERAKTEEQKAAVAKFEKTTKDAIEVRRSVIDDAIEAFRAGVKKLHEEKKSGIDSLVASYHETALAALEKAKTDCKNGEDHATVRQALKTALKSGKDDFISEKKAQEKLKIQMEALIQTRKNAIQKAITDFKATMETAKAELRESFPDEEI